MVKSFIGLLIVGGIGYLGYLLYDNYQSYGSEDSPTPESLLKSLESSAFSPLSNSSRIRSDISQKIEDAYQEGLIRRSEIENYRARIRYLQKALQERSQFEARYKIASGSDMKSFSEDVRARRTKLLQQDIERQWAEKRKSLKASYNRL